MSTRGILFVVFVMAGASVFADTFTVTNDSDTASPGSLRWAINQANTNFNRDNILFAIPPAGTAATIQPTGALPSITAPVTVDGWSQILGPTCEAGITLDGVLGTALMDGLTISDATNCDIKGLCIHRMGGNGITVVYGTSNRVYGCFIGTDRTGENYVGNGGNGIELSGAYNQIGLGPTTSCTNRNIISGNARDGIRVLGAGTERNRVLNNHIGAGFDGTNDIPNDWHGIEFAGNAYLNVVGSSDVGDIKPVNVISGNATDGVHVGFACIQNDVFGNHIGVTRDGLRALGNGRDGVHIEQTFTCSVGDSSGEGRNVISGNFDDGVEIRGTNCSGSKVYGNYIGLASNGLAAIGNHGDGVVLDEDAQQNWVGGATIPMRNIISGNHGCGVVLADRAHGNFVYGNFIGLSRDGAFAVTNAGHGVLLYGRAYGNSIGDAATANSGNYISGNGVNKFWNGVTVLDGAHGNTFARNVIGLNPFNLDVANRGNGVEIRSASNNYVGLFGGGGNVISGNRGVGIQISTTSGWNVVCANLVGLDTNGAAARPNLSHGVNIEDSFGNIVGTNSAGNVIAGNQGNGIQVLANEPLCRENRIGGNFIGIDATGSRAVSNNLHGIAIFESPSNTVGGIWGANVVAGNMLDGVVIGGAGAEGNAVVGNTIGADATGGVPLPNGQDGVAVEGAPRNRIGRPSGGNVVVASGRYGVLLHGAGTLDNRVQGNRIGVNLAGDALPNGNAGVAIHNSAEGNLVGGTNAADANVIAYNAGAGVRVITEFSTNNAILRNSIHDNAGLGIDHFPDGYDTNDDQDPDTGPNFRQNYPALYSATTGSLTIAGTLNGTPHTPFRIEFFLNTNDDIYGHGEGEIYLGHTNLSTGADGNLSNAFLVTFPVAAKTSQYVSATATDPHGNTSEFSLNIPIVSSDLWDADGDGMPGVWESDRGLDPNDNTGTNGAAGDPDGDATPNYDEYVADTDPADSNNCFQILSLSDPAGAVVTYSSTNTRYYMAYRGTNLADDAHWEGMYGSPLQGTNGTSAVTDTNSSTFRPYRVTVQISP